MNKKILMLLALLATVVVAGCGSGDGGSSGSKAPGNGTDRAFVDSMVPHHEDAIKMATIAQQRGESEYIQKLAGNIIQSQGREIETMKAEDKKLAAAGVEMGSLGMGHSMMGMDMDMDALENADPFDKEFFSMMIEHHQGAIEMAKVELSKGKDPTLKSLAQDIVDAQQKEIDEMKARS